MNELERDCKVMLVCMAQDAAEAGNDRLRRILNAAATSIERKKGSAAPPKEAPSMTAAAGPDATERMMRGRERRLTGPSRATAARAAAKSKAAGAVNENVKVDTARPRGAATERYVPAAW